MRFLPVVERELLVASRRRNTYWTRFFAGLIAIGACTWIWIAVGDSPRSELPKTLFVSLSILAYLYALLAGVQVTADCLSEEKREGTLGLLFLTDLKGYDVVLGKLVATSVNSFYRLLAVFPVLAIPLLFGGLTMSEFWRMILVLTNTLFFSLTVGMFFSAISKQERKTMAGTFLVIFLVTVGPPALGYLQAIRRNPFQYDETYLLASSAYSVYMAFDLSFKTGPQHFWTSVLITHVGAWALLVVASVTVRYSWQDKPAGKKGLLWRERWERWRFGDTAIRVLFRTRLLEINPFFWLAGRNRLKPTFVYAFLGLSGSGWLWLYFKYRNDMLDPTVYITTAIVLHTVVKFWVASDACRPLAEDRRSGALELVLSTPMTVDGILRGQILALKRQFAGPVAIILVADFVMFLAGMRNRFMDTSNGWPLLCLAGISLFILDLYTLAWVGMWLGLTARKANWAATGALARVLVLPWAVFCAFVTASVFINFDRGQLGDPGDLALGAWFVIGLLNSVFFLTWARSNLRQEFRTVVTQRFDARLPSPGSDESKAKVAVPAEAVQA